MKESWLVKARNTKFLNHQAKLHLHQDCDSHNSMDDEKRELSKIQNSEFLVDFDNFIEVYHDFMGDMFSASTTHDLTLGINRENYNTTMDLSLISYAYATIHWLGCDIILIDSWLTHGYLTWLYITFSDLSRSTSVFGLDWSL